MVALQLAYALWKRQDNGDNTDSNDDRGGPNGDPDFDHDTWWWSSTGQIVRHVIITVILAALLIYFVGGYFHARHRVRKGLPPLRYHAWMVRQTPRGARNANNPYAPYPQAPYQQTEGFNMGTYQPPPPAYNPASAPPPAYQPPAGASKAMADQDYNRAPVHRPEEAGEGSQFVTPPPTASRQG